MHKRIYSAGRDLLSPDAWKVRIIFWTGAVLVGLLATGFAIATEFANDSFRALIHQWPYAPLIICPAGLTLASYLTRRFFPGAQGSGIPQAIATLGMSEHNARKRILSIRIVVGKILLTLVGLFSGASIGREGPTVHIGAAIMFSLGHIAKFPMQYMDRGLILAGGAAGIAAAFNTPLAGILFAIEELDRSFESHNSGTLLTAVFLAGITVVAMEGNYVYFGTTDATLDLSSAFKPIFLCGILGGLLGGLFSQCIVWATGRLAPFARQRPVLLATLCGLVIAVTGLLSGGLTFGTGYEEAKMIITGTGELPVYYPLVKMLATLGSYLSGIPGGIFSPSLATGAGLGASLSEFMPVAPAGTLIILAMVGYFTGVVQTPITAFVIVMEMTDDTDMVLPLMATAFIAYATSKVICPDSIYRVLAESFIPARKTH
ncbi:MAG: chloride channel protein [Gammaproteobacteria bacterium]|jgi:H+/Cl- antiporter ClcA|nr:chloride channel protein [Gammaproteobacteria bacterium]